MIVRMAVTSSDAARALARTRWGSTRLDRLVAELRDRADELGDAQRDELRALADNEIEEN